MISEIFLDYGIYGINPNGSKEQRANCPECARRKPYQHTGSKKDKDLSVNIEENIWNCHRCGWTGKLKSEIDIEVREDPKTYQDKIRLYKFFQERGISKRVVDRNRIEVGWRNINGVDTECAIFKYYFNHKLVGYKYRGLKEKVFSSNTGGLKTFYKIDDIKSFETLICVEGEFDSLAFEEAGYENCISVPMGSMNASDDIGKRLNFFQNCEHKFKNIKDIYLALDNDENGIRMRDELSKLFGFARCKIVKFPEDCKDANDVLVKHGLEELHRILEEAEPYPTPGVKVLRDERARLLEVRENGYPKGVKTGYPILDDKLTWFKPMFTVITGYAGSGKSNWLDQVMVKLITHANWKFAVFSPENSEFLYHAHRLAEIYVGKPLQSKFNGFMSVEELDFAIDHLSRHVFSITDGVKDWRFETIVAKMRELHESQKIDCFIIDPWNKIEHNHTGSVTEYIGARINELLRLAKELDISVVVVTHPSKQKEKNREGKRFKLGLGDIADSQHWENKAEVGIVVDRVKDDEGKDQWVEVSIEKVKHQFIGRLGTVKFKYERSCQRYYEFDSILYKEKELNYGF